MKFLFLFLLFFLQQPGFTQVVVEIESDDILKERREKAKIQAIAESTATAATEFDLIDKMKSSSLFDKKVQNLLEKNLKEAKLWELPREEVKSQIKEGARGKATEKIFKTFPKLLDLATDMMRSKDAFPGLIQILGKEKALKQYFFIWLFLLISTWLVKKYIFPEEPNFWRRTFTKLMFTCFTSAVSLGVFYLFFQNELSPTISILSHTFWASGS